MNRTRTLAAAALTLVLAAPVAACGGGDDDQFREDYNSAVDRLSEINTDIGEAGTGAADRTNTQIAKEFDRIADTAEQTRRDLSELAPPDDARDEFDRLLSALKKGVADLRAVADAVTERDSAATRKAVQELSSSGQEITAAENELKQAVDG
jgi:hypothetical protein